MKGSLVFFSSHLDVQCIILPSVAVLYSLYLTVTIMWHDYIKLIEGCEQNWLHDTKQGNFPPFISLIKHLHYLSSCITNARWNRWWPCIWIHFMSNDIKCEKFFKSKQFSHCPFSNRSSIKSVMKELRIYFGSLNIKATGNRKCFDLLLPFHSYFVLYTQCIALLSQVWTSITCFWSLCSSTCGHVLQ